MVVANRDHCIAVGPLGKDPEERIPNGKRLVELSVIGYRDPPKDGQQWGDTHWVNVNVWGGTVTGDRLCRIASELTKDDVVLVAGRIKTSKYAAKDGSQKESRKLNAEFIIPLGMVSSWLNSDSGAVETQKFEELVDGDEDELPF